MTETVKKKIGVTLDRALHNRVKSVAPLRGLNIELVYDQALRSWLGEQVTHTANRMSAEEQRLADGLIRLLRSKDPMAEVVLTGLRRWMKDNPPGDRARTERE